MGRDGNVYVTDRSERVSVISPAGRVLRRWGKPGKGPGEFRFAPSDPNDPADVHGEIALGSTGLVYVSDSGNARVQVFTSTGRYVRQFGSFGSGNGQFLRPFDLVVDDRGNVYVADDDRQTLAKFGPSGKPVWQVGGSTSPEPDLVGHLHVNEIDAHGRLVVANDDTSRIVYLDKRGQKVDGFGRSSDFVTMACDVTVDAFGYTYVSGCLDGVGQVFDRTHHRVGRWSGTKDALRLAPRFAAGNRAYALGLDGSVLELEITLPRR
jgi:DNA-binding beta-propeller fold protein YncE